MPDLDSEEYKKQVQKRVQASLETSPKWVRQSLMSLRGDEAAFEGRLRVRWGHAFDLFQLVFGQLQNLGHSFNNRHRLQAAQDNDYQFDALVTLHARASLLASEVFALLRTGHPGGALARWRSLHEIVVLSQVLRENDVILAEKFMLHEVIERWRAAKIYQRYAKALGEEPLNSEFMKRLDKQVAALRVKYGAGYLVQYGWASELLGKQNPSLEQLEQYTNLDYLRPYYSLASEGIHAEFKGLRRTIFTMGEDVMLAGPTNYGLADAAQYTLWSFYQCTVILISLKPTPDDDAALLILSQLVTQAAKAFVTIQKEIKQDEAEIREEVRINGDRRLNESE